MFLIVANFMESKVVTKVQTSADLFRPQINISFLAEFVNLLLEKMTGIVSFLRGT